MVSDSTPLMHESELVLDGQGHLGHTVGLELGQREVEIFIALFHELFEREGRNVDEFLDPFQKDRDRRGFIQIDRDGSCFLADS